MSGSMTSTRCVVGDCREVMRELPENSVDAIVTDPPYGLEFMGKEWDRLDWRDGGGMTKPGIGERAIAWPSFGGETANPTCATCGGRARGAKKCACDEPDWKVRGESMDRAAQSVQRSRSMQSWHESWAREAYRVLKPGGHLLAFGGSRTYHRLACAIEDAGFEIRDQLQWLYGSGFPKSLDVSKAMDRANGREFEDRYPLARHIRARREALGITRAEVRTWFPYAAVTENWERQDANGARIPGMADWLVLKARLGLSDEFLPLIERAEAEREVIGVRDDKSRAMTFGGGETQPTLESLPATDLARQWEGFGTALKPSHEPIVLARKPLIGTVAANVTEHDTGALNIAATRIGSDSTQRMRTDDDFGLINDDGWKPTAGINGSPLGRWPSNVILGHSPKCREVGVKRVKSQNGGNSRAMNQGRGVFGDFGATEPDGVTVGYADADGYETVTAWECAPDCAAALLDAQSGERKPGGRVRGTEQSDSTTHIYGDYTRRSHEPYRDAGGASRFFLNVKPDDEVWYICESDGIVLHIADLTSGCPECGATMVPYRVPIEGDEARFFYCAKASRTERNAGLDGMPERKSSDDGYVSIQQPILDRAAPRENWQPHKTANHHPTVKPISLMRWLVRLITPTRGTVLDPFMGSGTTGIAAALEGFDFIGVEQDRDYLTIAERRIAYWRNVRESLTMQSTLL